MQRSQHEDDAWSLSLEDDKQSELVEQMTQELNAASLSSSHRPQPNRKASAGSSLWSYFSRRSSDNVTLPSVSSGSSVRPPTVTPARHNTKPKHARAQTSPAGATFASSSTSFSDSSAAKGLGPAVSRARSETTADEAVPRQSTSSSASSSDGNQAPGNNTWVHIDSHADASSALRGKAVALLSREEMQAAVRLNVTDILTDPASSIRRLRVSEQDTLYDGGPSAEPLTIPPNSIKNGRLLECLVRDSVDLSLLRKLAWSGLPDELRPMTWQLLLGYLPAPSARRVSVLARKRQEYADAVKASFAKGIEGLNQSIWHQIHIDVLRTNPGVPLWQFEATQKALERVLYVWAIRHPASGYVQGINDLVTPFFQVFLSQYIDTESELFDPVYLPKGVLEAIEADSFWCLNKLLDGIQDNYVSGQPGIRVKVKKLRDLCERVDLALFRHLEENNIEFMQFAFKWIHLLLLRVLPIDAVVRMWDTYMCESSNAFADFHTYVCLAFLRKYSSRLQGMDFQAMMLFFQSPVEHDIWTPTETEVLLSEGYLWKSIFNPSSH